MQDLIGEKMGTKNLYFCEITESEQELIIFADGDHLLQHIQNNDPSMYGQVELAEEDQKIINSPDFKAFPIAVPLFRYREQLGID